MTHASESRVLPTPSRQQPHYQVGGRHGLRSHKAFEPEARHRVAQEQHDWQSREEGYRLRVGLHINHEERTLVQHLNGKSSTSDSPRNCTCGTPRSMATPKKTVPEVNNIACITVVVFEMGL